MQKENSTLVLTHQTLLNTTDIWKHSHICENEDLLEILKEEKNNFFLEREND